MTAQTAPVARRVDRVLDKVDLGPTAMSAHSALIIAPGTNAWTDPFLLMGEELVNQPGFDWHPHRGMETVTLILDGGACPPEPDRSRPCPRLATMLRAIGHPQASQTRSDGNDDSSGGGRHR